jgi:PAS domain S-box-containing protein
MSELINNSQKRKELLKHMILQLHEGEVPDLVRKRLVDLLKNIPYDEVVEVEQELISEGLPEEEVLQFCDIHTMVLDGHIDQTSAKQVPPGHPVDTFKKENRELEKVVDAIDLLLGQVPYLKDNQVKELFLKLHARFNELMDVDKHYKRKEYLLFPFLEKYEITGPPKVMWGKHDEVREKLKASIEIVSAPDYISADEARAAAELVLNPAIRAIPDMIMKEEEILFPMCMDKLTDEDWYSIDQQTMEFGYCLYDPQVTWKPEGVVLGEVVFNTRNSIQLSTGSYDISELEALFKSLPLDITFVDRDDKVKFFSQGAERIFTRNRAILGRDVRMCHPPSSVHVVEQILSDFKSRKENSAAFWINMQGRFIYIEYFALRGREGEYLGTIEITQDLTHLRKLEGEQRLLSYHKKVK